MATLTVHQLLRAWRDAKELKLDRAALLLSDELGREISRETVRRYEVEQEAPKYLDPMILAGLARIYDQDPSDLPPGVVENLKRLAKVIDISHGRTPRVPSNDTPPDQPKGFSTWVSGGLRAQDALADVA